MTVWLCLTKQWLQSQDNQGIRQKQKVFKRAESPRMDILLAAVLGELTTRSINFFIGKSFKPTALDVEDRLCRILLRAQVIVDEAMGRQITSQAMLQQLDMLREAMYQGYYILDTFRYQYRNKEEARGYDLAKFREGYEMEHRSLVSNSNKDGRLLIVLELVDDLNEDAWSRLYSASIHHLSSGSKIIVTSQSDKIMKFGTTQALRMKFLSHEAYWYFFKTLAFGSMDPKMHPRLAHLAMEIAKMLNPCFIGAKMTACLLRDNFDIHLWYKVLGFLRVQMKTNLLKFGGRPFDLVNQKRPAYIGRMATPSEDAVLYDEHQCSSQEEIPKISVQDVVYGSVKAHGKFKVLGWRSQILPYHNYIFTCEIRELKTRAPKRKRSMKH
ncbi:uncharacterized protein [Miscanthus floridulus]|uniref:uncharacterized protein isoform X3 n=1 Tax=Miscanthus floridulus TaxID=154761 RepID=UPI00345987D4